MNDTPDSKPPAPPPAPEVKPPEAPPPPPPPATRNLVGVKYRNAGKTFFFDAGPLMFRIGEMVIVETDKGLGLARVVAPVEPRPAAAVPADTKRVIRKANWNDLERDRKNKERQQEALSFCVERIRERRLPMKLIQVEYFHDASKAIFYFFAEQRVDFRDLVKDLAHHLHTRIEMKQIGVRDEAKIIGGMGNCGEPVCCNTFLSEFAPVSVRMAKDQNLAMNPTKVSGLCGRLMCCLAYEHGHYQEALRNLPRKGKRVQCCHGICKVADCNIFKQTVLVETPEGTLVELPAAEVHRVQTGEPAVEPPVLEPGDESDVLPDQDLPPQGRK
jgi:cell fate regulator YaaT (PSP1 superfamily)